MLCRNVAAAGHDLQPPTFQSTHRPACSASVAVWYIYVFYILWLRQPQDWLLWRKVPPRSWKAIVLLSTQISSIMVRPCFTSTVFMGDVRALPRIPKNSQLSYLFGFGRHNPETSQQIPTFLPRFKTLHHASIFLGRVFDGMGVPNDGGGNRRPEGEE